jgi:tetratricopeptide (TPR) repeat protein
MAKKPPAPAAPPKSEGSTWLAFGLMGLCGLLIGSTGTYLLLLPKLQRGSAVPTVASAAAEPLAHLPSADLTAGMPPAQADRTLGNFYYDHQNWAQAIRSYEAAIKQGSDDADIRTDLGNAYRFSNRPEEALAQYDRAQRMNPAHEFSLFNQGGLYLEDLKQPQKALEIWHEYLVRFPQGSNVAAAQQLIAQASGLPPGSAPFMTSATVTPASAPPASTGPSQAEVERLLRLAPPAKP